MRERALSSIGAIACDVFDALMVRMASSPPNQVPRLRLCGHSMGAQVAFEVCKHFEDYYGSSTPVSQLVLSGCHAPHLESRRKLSHLNDQDFVEQLIEIGSGSPVLKQHPELLALFLPMLRADFSATENYLTTQGAAPKLAHTPCTLMFGEQDPEAWSSEVIAWQDWHSCPEMTSVSGLSGDYFYITAQPTQFIQSVINHAHDAHMHLISNLENLNMAKPSITQYHNHIIPHQCDPLAIATELSMAEFCDDYVVYEHNQEWSIGINKLAELTVDTQGKITDFSGHVHQPEHDLICDTIYQATQTLPWEGWRVFGRVDFEFSHFAHHLAQKETNRTLLELFVAQHDIRISNHQLAVRTTDDSVLPEIHQAIARASSLVQPEPMAPLTQADILDHHKIQHDYQTIVASAVREIVADDYKKSFYRAQLLCLLRSISVAVLYLDVAITRQPVLSCSN